jgi:sigma-B regulation protein RsbU (phosphoserine phosphatase)
MQLKDAHVLIIDDNPQIRMLLSRTLGSVVATVRDAEDAIAGLGRWVAERPQLVFVDYEMPELSGATFVKILRAQEQALGLRTAVLMITGHSDREHVLAAHEAGADGFIVKPLATEDVLGRAAQALASLSQGEGREAVYL